MTPQDEIKTFLRSNRADPQLSHDVALQFALGMSQELRKALSEWEAVIDALERGQIRREPRKNSNESLHWRRHG